MTKYYFKIESKAQFEAAKAYFLTLGFTNGFGPYTYDRLVKENFLFFVINIEDKGIVGYNEAEISGVNLSKDAPEEFKEISFHEAFLLQIPITVTVKLNDNHIAEVSKTGIKVGCQNFTLDIIDALVEARNKIVGPQ